MKTGGNGICFFIHLQKCAFATGGFIKGLREVGYKGNINMETSSFVQLFPKELIPAALKLLAAEADYFRMKVKA